MQISSHVRMFNIIAPVYSLFFSRQVKSFRRTVVQNPSVLLDGRYRILDVGCGTGALAFVLAELGHEVKGIDASARMISLARRFNRRNQAVFELANVLDLVDPADHLAAYQEHYDVVVASYVLHGLEKEQRMALYAVMKLLALKRVIIMDYNQTRGALISFVEWLERGDYFRFIKTIEQEMNESFPTVRIIQTGKRAAWYICECETKP